MDLRLTYILGIRLYADRSKLYINAKKITSRKRDSTAAKRIIDRNVHIETKIKRIVPINYLKVKLKVEKKDTY